MADETRKVAAPDMSDPGTRRVADLDASGTRRVTEADLPTPRRAEGEPERPLPLGVLPPGAVLCGDYTVEQPLIPHESQRPGVYLCRGPEGRVVVKVAALNFPPHPELWHRLVFLTHPHILRTYRVEQQGAYFFEVQEYCPNGTLADLVPAPGTGRSAPSAAWIEQVLVAQLHAALSYLHAQEIIHRDIKPANIYRKLEGDREVLVLADFDISSVLEQTRTSRDTARTAGTWLYTAPEAFPRFVDDHASSRRGRITRSSDYYALGITIIELLLGTTSLHLCQLPDLFDFYLQGGRVEVPAGIPGRLSLLLRGLLIRSRHTRWGPAEVERWLRNQTTDDDLRRIQDDEYFELARASRPYRLRERYAVDLPGLAEAMFREPDVATEDLITADILLNWIGGLDPAVAREIRRDRDRLYLYPALVLHSAIMRCDPTRPFIFPDGTEVTTKGDWLTAILAMAQRTGTTPETVATPELVMQFEAWLRLQMAPEPAVADAVEQIRLGGSRGMLEEIAYLLQPERPFFIMRGVTAATPKDVAVLAYGKPEEWRGAQRPACYEAVYQRWRDGALCAWLRQRGLAQVAQQIDEIRQGLGEETYAAFETALRQLDPALPKVTVELNTAALANGCTLFHGRARRYALKYTARGPGMPFGTVTLIGARPGIALAEPLIRQREGTVELVFIAQADIPAGTTHWARLDFESTLAQLAGSPVRFSYRMTYPWEDTAKRVLAGAGIGAVLLGLPRMVLSLLTSGSSSAEITDVGTLWEVVSQWQFPWWEYVVAFLLFLGALYVGLVIGLWLLRRSKA